MVLRGGTRAPGVCRMLLMGHVKRCGVVLTVSAMVRGYELSGVELSGVELS